MFSSKIVKRISHALIVLICSTLVHGEIKAQQADETVVPEYRGRLDEITVTARKQAESLQDVPVTAKVFNANYIDRYDLTSLEKIAATTPELVVARASNGAGAQLTMRGIGSMPTSIGLEQSVSVVIDGVYFGQGRSINEALFDSNQVEILKGPQSLFFGKNATAGVISFTTAGPTDEFEAMARVGYEVKAENVFTEGYVSGPISSKIGARLAVRVSEMFGGYYRNGAVPVTNFTFDAATFQLFDHFAPPSDGDMPGTSEQFVRGTLEFEPNDRLTVTFKGMYLSTVDESNGWNYSFVGCPLGFAQFNPDVPCEKNFEAYVNLFPEDIRGNIRFDREDGRPFNNYESYAFWLDVDYEFDKFSIVSVTNYQHNRNKWGCSCQNISTPLAFISATERSSWRAFSNETRFQSTLSGPFNIMLGVLYQDTKRDHFQAANFGGIQDSSQPEDLRYLAYSKPSFTKGETISAFTQANIDITPDLELAGGVRYTHETKDSLLVQDYVNVLLQGLFPENQPFTADQEFNNWSPEATLTYQVNDDLTVYAAYKTAYKSGGFSSSALIVGASAAEDFAFEPETAEGFEVGIKSVLMDRQLRLNLTGYLYDYDDLQVDFFDSVTFQFITTNAGSARIKGLELDIEYAPNQIEGLTLRGSFNWNRARFRDYIAPCYVGQTPAQGCDTAFRSVPGQDLSGKPTAVAPEIVAMFAANYDVAISNDWRLGLSMSARYSDDYLANTFGAPLSKQSSYVNLDAAIRIVSADDRWEFAVIGRNLTNQFYFGGTQANPSSGSGTGTANGLPADQTALGSLPRTVRFQATWRY